MQGGPNNGALITFSIKMHMNITIFKIPKITEMTQNPTLDFSIDIIVESMKQKKSKTRYKFSS